MPKKKKVELNPLIEKEDDTKFRDDYWDEPEDECCSKDTWYDEVKGHLGEDCVCLDASCPWCSISFSFPMWVVYLLIIGGLYWLL